MIIHFTRPEIRSNDKHRKILGLYFYNYWVSFCSLHFSKSDIEIGTITKDITRVTCKKCIAMLKCEHNFSEEKIFAYHNLSGTAYNSKFSCLKCGCQVTSLSKWMKDSNFPELFETLNDKDKKRLAFAGFELFKWI